MAGLVDPIDSITKLGEQKGLKFLNLNVRSLFKKIDQCRLWCSNEDVDIISFSETWLNKTIPDSALSIDGYQCIRQDRNLRNTRKTKGGGLVTYVHDRHSDKIQELPELSITNSNCEALWTKLTMPHSRDIIFCNIYRPPNGKIKTFLEYLEECLSSINTDKSDIFIMGDVNVDYSSKQTANYKKLSFFIKSNQLEQKISCSTRTTCKSATILDLVITNSKYVSNAGTLPSYFSDHQPIFVVKKKTRDNRPKVTFEGRTYKNFNVEEFKTILSRKAWVNIIDFTSVEKAWQTLFKEIVKELDLMCPRKKFKTRSKKPAWMDHHLIEQMKDRDYFYRKAKRTGEIDDWNIAKHLRNTVNASIRQAKANYIIGELETSKDDPKKFWRIIKSVFPSKQNKTKKGLSLVDNDGCPVKSAEVPNYVNDYFVNIGGMIALSLGKGSGGVPVQQTPPTSQGEDLIEFADVNETDVYREVRKVNIKKSSGYSEINSKCLKLALEAVIPELTVIFNLSINMQKFPNTWKVATVIPIPKPGNRKEVRNYRPISLLPLPGKILEKLIHRQLGQDLELSNFFTDSQHGFRKNRSTTHAVLQLVNHININADMKTPTMVVFIDFRKAFDCVCHEKLVDKLASANLSPGALNWIRDYLDGRKQRVLANGIKSDSLDIQQGVPQGSTLGPLFYIVYAKTSLIDLTATFLCTQTTLFSSPPLKILTKW